MRRARSMLIPGLIGSLLATVVAVVPAVAAEAADEVAPDDPAPAAEIGAIVERLPDVGADDDAAELRALAGPPDAFTIAFEPADDGSMSRREEWFYYDIATAFELADGQLLSDWPLTDLPPILVHPLDVEPAAFTAGATWDSLAQTLDDPASFESVVLEEGYGIPATIYVGDFLLLAFDEDGELFYVEALPLSGGAAE